MLDYINTMQPNSHNNNTPNFTQPCRFTEYNDCIVVTPTQAVRFVEMSRDWPLLSWGLCILVGAGLLLGCERRTGIDPEALEADDELRPVQTTHEPRFVLHEGGSRRAILEAPRMYQYETEDSTYAVMRGPYDADTTVRIHVQLSTPEGDSSSTIAADSLLYFSGEGRADAYGDVEIHTPDNRELYSEHVVWTQGDRKVRSSRFVRIVTPNEVLNGLGIVADEDLSSYQIGRFEAEVELDDD